MFFKKVAGYVFIDKENEFQSRIACSISTVSGEFVIEVVEMKGFKFTQNETFFFATRDEANAAFVEIRNNKKYNYSREF